MATVVAASGALVAACATGTSSTDNGPHGTGGTGAAGTGGNSAGGAGPIECQGQPDGTFCGVPSEPDCDLSQCQSGVCVAQSAPVSTTCGDATDDECTNPDSCDGTGTCLPNNEPEGTVCGDDTDDECTNPDSCDGEGVCSPNDEPADTACGDATDDECTNPDSCDGLGVCDPNDEPAGTACGDGSDSDCTDPDSCDGSGLCVLNDELDGTSCNDCPAGAGNCSTCLDGACQNACVSGALTTTYAGGNGFTGNMFDMTAVTNVTIQSFDWNLDTTGSATVEVYYRQGTFVGHTTSSAGWTLATSVAVQGQGAGTPTALNLNLNITMPAGQTYGWYLTTTGASIDYTDGSAVGSVYSQDSHLQIKEGNGGDYFDVTFSPRIVNATVHYEACP